MWAEGVAPWDLGAWIPISVAAVAAAAVAGIICAMDQLHTGRFIIRVLLK